MYTKRSMPPMRAQK